MKFGTKMHRGHRTIKGFTLVELMITIAVIAVGVALAIPTYENISQRRQTTAQAEELASFLAFAQSEAIKSNTPVAVRLIHTTADNWCVGIVEGTAACDCKNAPNACMVDGSQTVFTSLDGAFAKASMSAFASDVEAIADDRFVFDPIRGIKDTAFLANHGFTIQSDNAHWALQVNVGPTGRIRVCNPDTDKKIPGFDACPTVSVPPVVVGVDPDPDPEPPPPPIGIGIGG